MNLEFVKKLCFIVSLITTTGVLPSEFDENIYELTLNKYLFIFLFVAVIGSFSGTTNGGIKLNKISLFLINFKEELNKFLFQHNIKGVSIIKKGSSQVELNSFYALIILSSIIIILNLGTMKQAAATSALFIFFNSISGFFGYYLNDGFIPFEKLIIIPFRQFLKYLF